MKRAERCGMPPKDSIERANQKYQSVRDEYDQLAHKFSHLALVKRSGYAQSQIDSLMERGSGLKLTISNHLLAADALNRNMLFCRNIETIRQDILYALAKAQKIGGFKGALETNKKAETKTKAIDQEIDKLKDKIKELNQSPQPEKK